MSVWDTDLAFERARVAYRYVAADFPYSADLGVLEPHTAVAYAAERRGDMPAYLDVLRELMRRTKAEAMRERAGVA